MEKVALFPIHVSINLNSKTIMSENDTIQFNSIHVVTVADSD